MRKLSLLVAVLALVCLTQIQAQDAKKDLAALAGSYTVVSFEQGGEKVPDKLIQTMSVFLQGNKLTLKADDKVVEEFSLKIDPTKNPKQIDFTYLTGNEKGMTEAGIYQAAGDQVRFCFNDVGKERPKDFASPAKSTISLINLKRKK